jgi:hypothetical protein
MNKASPNYYQYLSIKFVVVPIFLVEIGQELDSGIFEVKLIESFKGEFNSKTKILNPINDFCSYSVKTDEELLIYAYQTEIIFVVIDGCSRSRNIKTKKYLVPTPPPYRNKESQKEYELMFEKYLKSDRGYIEDELNKLRELKANKHK